MKKYTIRDHKHGMNICDEETLTAAKKQINVFIREDKKEGGYEEDYYEVYDNELQEVVYIK